MLGKPAPTFAFPLGRSIPFVVKSPHHGILRKVEFQLPGRRVRMKKYVTKA
jgi:hypothetical protein